MQQNPTATTEQARHFAEELLPLYAIGATDPDESRSIGVHVENGCSRCCRELAALAVVAAALADTMPRRRPSDLARYRTKRMIRERVKGAGRRAPRL